MGELIVSAAGAAIGGIIGGPTGAKVGWAIGSAVGSAAFAEDAPAVRGPRMEDGRITSSAYGEPIPMGWGTFSISGKIIDAGEVNERESEHTTSSKSFGGQSQTATTYSYDVDLDVLLMAHAIDDIVQIYVDEELLYDATPGATIVSPDWLAFTLYRGEEDQLPDPTFEAIRGVGNVPAYRGVSRVVFRKFRLKGASPAVNLRFVVTRSATHSVSESSLDPGGEVALVGYSPRAQTIVVPVSYSAPQTAGADRVALLGIDPYSRAIVWQTSITDADQFYQHGPAVSCVHPSYQGFIEAVDTAICVATKGFPATTGHFAFFDAITGAMIARYAVPDWAIYPRFAFLRPQHLSAILHTSNVSSVVSVSLLGFQEGIFSATSIDPPAGYAWAGPGPDVASNGAGKVLLPALTDPAGDAAVVLIDASSGLLDSVTGIDLGTDFNGPVGIAWDASSDVWWIIGANSGTANDGTVVYSVDEAGQTTEYDLAVLYGDNATMSAASGAPLLWLDELNGELWWQDTAGGVHGWNPYTTEAPRVYSGGSNQGGLVFHRPTRTAWGAHIDTVYGFHTVGITGASASLQGVVEDLCDGTELLSSDIDASALNGIAVSGFTVARQMARRDALQALRSAYLFDFVPRAGVLTGLLRGGAAAATITADKLGAHLAGADVPPALTVRARNEARLPKQFDLTYISAAQNYEPMTHTARRLASAGGTAEQVSVAIVLGEDEGAQLGDTLMHLRHIGSESYETMVMPSQSAVCQPGEVVDFVLDGETYTCRIESATVIDGGIIAVQGQRDDASLYDSFAVGGSPRARSRTVVAAGVTLLFPLDLPMLRATDNDAGIYAAFASYTPGWPGCEVYQSLDGETFNLLDTHSTPASMGVVMNATADWESLSWDLATTLQLRPINSSFASEPWENAIVNGNLAAWGRPGRLEIVAYADAQQQVDGTWHISGLARGLRDTLGNAQGHVAGDLFIVLGSAQLARYAWSADQYAVPRTLKAATFGTFLADAVPQSVTPTGQALLPFAPTRLHASLSGSTWSLSWMRQDRQLARMWQNPTNSEASEEYRIRILDSLGVVLGEHTATSEVLSYDAAMQTADYGGEVTAIYYQVAQVSAVVGPGHWSDVCAVVFQYPLVDVSGTASAFISNGDYNASYLADYAFDDNATTQWQSNAALSGTANYVGCQFATAQAVQQVTIQQTEFGASGYGYATQCVIEYSDNGSSWTTVDTVTLAENETVQPFDLPVSGSHTYWRIRATAWDVGGYRWAVKELELMAPDVP